MATGPGFPQANNTFIPHDLSGRLRIGFSRNAKKFHLPKYIEYVECPKSTGYFLKITTQEAARILTEPEVSWPDGAPDPLTDTGTESFKFVPFVTERRRYRFRVGDKAEKQAVWPIVESNAQNKAAQCMTNRTNRVLTVATTAANWNAAGDTDNLSGNHTATATAAGGGKFDVGTSTAPYIKNALGYAASLINKDTLGVVDSDPDSLLVIINPDEAIAWAKSPELHDYIKGSYWAQDEIHKGAHPNGKYGLPSTIYGYSIVVENCVKVTNTRKSAKAASYAMPASTVLMVSKPKQLEGIYGAPSFSTLSMFWYQDEMTVETKHEDWDRLTDGRVVEDTSEQVTCPASGFLFTATSG
ncbi:MAG TPA: hypothetical protein VEI97_08370 [bacterium]|nr:hypothetical protein [bacterium]